MSVADETRSDKAERKSLPIGIRRMRGLLTAAELLNGQKHLAEALGIGARALRHKLSATHGISDENLLLAAVALEKQGERIASLAQKLRNEVASTGVSA